MVHGEPSDDSLAEVLNAAPNMLDPDASIEHADPYVVAMALELTAEPDFDVIVVSGDRVDRPGHTSVVTACGRLQVRTATVDAFLGWVRGVQAAPDEPPEAEPDHMPS
jgi:hypothetical protein